VAKFMMSINEEEGTIGQMAKALSITKGEVVILSLNVLYYILEQRKSGNHLIVKPGDDKTADILKEAVGDDIKFKLNQ
jgi:hypothetical protein